MKRVDIEDVIRMENERSVINRIPFDEVEWYRDGKKLDASQKVLNDFKFTGLCNTDFVTTDFYNDGFDEE